jgi:hypothetical protein
MAAIEYVRILVAGVAARLWRGLTGGPCRCEICREHRAFARRAARADLPTITEVRHRRYR